MASALTRPPAGRHSAASDEETSEINTDTMRWCGCGCSPLRGGACRRAPRAQAAALCAEAAGTALLVVLSCLATCEGDLPLAHRALAAGLVVAVVVQCFDHVSGAQVNPTVTLAAAVAGRQPWAAAAAEAAAQLAGGAAGAGLARLLPPGARPDGYCVTRPAADLPLYKALCVEALLGACLALANCASWDARNRCLRDSWPLRIGLTVAALSFVAGDLTGASMNPARSFGPALWSGVWTDHWVYWCGPPAGSAAATLVYRAVWRAPPGAPARGQPEPAPPPPCKTPVDA